MSSTTGRLKVSAVIPAFNRASVLAECVESVLAQSHRDLEVIVVDDGSTDDTAVRIKPFLADRRVRYEIQSNQGAGAARNRGVELSTGDVVSFLDSDDLWKPDKTANDVEFLLQHPDVDAVFSDVERLEREKSGSSFSREFEFFSPLLPPGTRSPSRLVLPARTMYLCLLQELPIKTTTLSVRRRALAASGGFDPTIVSGQDWEFFLRLSKRHNFGYIDLPLASYRTSRDSLHLVTGVKSLRTMWGILKDEKRRLKHDMEARAAASKGIRNRCRRVAWFHLDRGERGSAVKAYCEGFWDTGDPTLLLRAIGSVLPSAWVERAKRWNGRR